MSAPSLFQHRAPASQGPSGSSRSKACEAIMNVCAAKAGASASVLVWKAVAGSSSWTAAAEANSKIEYMASARCSRLASPRVLSRHPNR